MQVVHNIKCTNWFRIKSNLQKATSLFFFLIQYIFGSLHLSSRLLFSFRTVRCGLFRFFSRLRLNDTGSKCAVRANNQHVCESSILCPVITAFVFVNNFLFYLFTHNNKNHPVLVFLLLLNSFFVKRKTKGITIKNNRKSIHPFFSVPDGDGITAYAINSGI